MTTPNANPRAHWFGAVAPYFEKESIAAFLLGMSSGFPYAMIGATLTTRLAQDGIDKKTVTAFTLAFLVYNLKVFWAWIVDSVPIPGLSRLGQRRSWLILSAFLVVAAVASLALVNPATSLISTVRAAVFVGIAGATFDIVIDAYRIETLKPYQLGVGAGMSQYGWRIGSAGAGALALVVAGRLGWSTAYLACVIFVLPALIAAAICGEPARVLVSATKKSVSDVLNSIWLPFAEFFQRRGAALILLFILLHKIGDTVANLTFRLLFNDLGFSNDEIAAYDVGIGFWAYLIGIFLGGLLYAHTKLKHGVMCALILMAVSNLSFAVLAHVGHSNWGMAAAIGFENIASGLGGVVLVAFFSALCDLRFTASQYAMISACASVIGRLLTGGTAGKLIEIFGFVDFYLLTTAFALPGIILFWQLIRYNLIAENTPLADNSSHANR